MDFKNLDRMFDELTERSDRKKPLLKSPYSMDSMASDHFLLSKGWNYFRLRIRSIEEEWKKVLTSKDEEIRALGKMVNELKGQVGELEQGRKSSQAFYRAIKELRFSDYRQLRKEQFQLKEFWENERFRLDQEIRKLKEDGEQKEELLAAERKRFETVHRDPRVQEGQARQQQLEESKKVMAVEAEKLKLSEEFSQEVEARELRIDLLKSEVERRDEALRQVRAHLEERKMQIRKLDKRAREFAQHIEGQQKVIQNLETKLDIRTNENETLRQDWKREEAQWRELWDRERKIWEDRSPKARPFREG